MFYSVEAAMANYRDESSQPSKFDGCVNHHKYKIAKGLFYHNDKDSLDSCKLKGIAITLMKYIEDAPMKMQYSIDFARDIRKKLLCLHYDISRFLKHNKKFPFSSELHNLLVRYVELEHDILYHPKNFSKEYQKVVEQQILFLLQSIFYDPIGVRKKLVSSPEEAGAINSLYILKFVKPEIKKSRGWIHGIMEKLLTKLNLLDEINKLRRTDSDINFDKILKVSHVQKLHKYLATQNNYNNDYFHSSDDEFDMEIEDIKKEIKVEQNQNDDIELIVSSNQQCITIDLDSDTDSEDCHSLDVRKNTLDLNMKRAQTSTSLSKSQLNSFTTSNICDNKRLLCNSDKSPMLKLYRNENRLYDTNSCNLSNSKSDFHNKKIQNGTTRRNIVDEAKLDQDTSFHMFYDDSQYRNFKLKRELLLLDNDEHLCIPSKLYDISEKLKRYIDECPKSVRYTKRFVNGIHRTLIYLYESMCRLVKGNREFLLSSELHALLVTYFELEYEVLYASKNFSRKYEESVQNRILHLFVNMLFNPTVDGSTKQYVKSAEEASLLSTLYVVRGIKPEYKKQHSLLENILKRLMLKLNVLDNINKLRSKNKNMEYQQLLSIPQFNKICKYMQNRDLYGIRDCNSSEDHLDMVEVKPSIKNEEIDVKPNVGVHHHLDKRKLIVIDLDEEDDDCFMICDVGKQQNVTMLKIEENSSQSLFDNVLIKGEAISNNSDDYSVSNLCNNNQNNAYIIIDDSDEEESSCLLEKGNSAVACVSNMSDALEEELLQLEDADSDIKSEDENEILNRFMDEEYNTNEKISNSCGSEESNCDDSNYRQATTVDQQLTSKEAETSFDKNKTNNSLHQNEILIEVSKETVSHSYSSIENIHPTICEEIPKAVTNKSIDLSSLTNDEMKQDVTETNNCSSGITDEFNLASQINLDSNKDCADNADIDKITNAANSAVTNANENIPVEKDTNLVESSTSILNIISDAENLSVINDNSKKDSEIQVLSENDSNAIIYKSLHNIEEIQHTTSISDGNIQDEMSNLNLTVNKASEADINLEIANDGLQVQHSTSNIECIEELDFTSKNSTTNLSEQNKPDNFNLEIDDSLNKNYDIQKDINSKTLILSNEESIVQGSQLVKIDKQISNPPPQEFTEIIQVTENKNLNAFDDGINIIPESSDLVENEVVIFQEKNAEDVCEDTQLLENEIDTTSKSLELFESEESIIHTDVKKNVAAVGERSDSFENEEPISVLTEYDKEVVTAESANSIVEKEVHLACENSESFESESVTVHTENEQSSAVSTVHEDLFVRNAEFEVFCETSNSNKNPELNTIELLEVHAEVDVVSDDVNEELCVLEDESIQSKKETIEDLQATVVEHLEVQKVIEVTSENDEMFEDKPNRASKNDFNFQENNYVKESTDNENVIEDDATKELHIEIQDSIAVIEENKNCKEGLKSNVTFDNHSNLLNVLAQVASEQQKIEDSLEMEDDLEIKNKSKKKSAAMKNTKRKQISKNKKSKKSSTPVKRVTRSSSLKAKENVDTEPDYCKFPSNFMNLENYVSPPPNRIYDLIISNPPINEESVDGSDSDQTNQQFGDTQLNTFLINNSIFDEDTIEDGIEFICHKRKNKIETSISKCVDSVVHPVQEIDSNNIFNIDTQNKSRRLENFEDSSLNFQIKTSETFTRKDINNQFNVKLLLNHDEETKSFKSKSKSSAKKKTINVKGNLKCADLCANNEEFDSCLDVKTTSNKTRRTKLKQNTEKKLNKSKNQKLCLDNVSIKTKRNKCSDDEVHVPYEKTEEMIVQDVGIENVTEAELEFEVITEETCELSDIQINAEVTGLNNDEAGNNIAIDKNSVPCDIDLSSNNSATNKNYEEECLTNILNTSENVEIESTTDNISNDYQECTNMKHENDIQINPNTSKIDFEPENEKKEENGKIVDNEQLNLNKSAKLRHSKIKKHSKDIKKVAPKMITERKCKGEKKNYLKIVEDSMDVTISDSPLVITNSIKSSKITTPNVNMQCENVKTKKEKLLKSYQFQCSNRSNIKKCIAKNSLSKKLGIRKKNKNMITKKRIKFLRETLKKTVTRDRIKTESAENLKKAHMQVDSNSEIPQTNNDNNGIETCIKNERTKKKRKAKKALPKSTFLNEENWICSPIEQELSRNEIDVPSKPLENSVENTMTKSNRELNLMKETELIADNNLQVNSALTENESMERAIENKEPISINSEKDKIETENNVIPNVDCEEAIESPKINEVIEISKGDKNETTRMEDQLTDENSSKEPCERDIVNTTVESSAVITKCIDVDISKEVCDDNHSIIAIKKGTATIEEPHSTTSGKENTTIQEESNIDELLKNDLPSMSTLVEEIKTKKRKLSESEHVQVQEEQFAIKECSVIEPQIQTCEPENKTNGKFSKRRLRSSKTNSKSKVIDSITENLRNRSYQRIKRNAIEGTKTTLENVNTIKNDTKVDLTKIDIKVNADILKEENTEIMAVDNKINKLQKESNITSEIAKVEDDKRNQKVERKTNLENTEIDDSIPDQKVQKEVSIAQEIEKVANITSEITAVHDNQQVDNKIITTSEIIESDGKKTNKEIEQELNTTSEIVKVSDNNRSKEIQEEGNATSEIIQVDDDNKTNNEIEQSFVTITEPSDLKKTTFIEINVDKTNEEKLEESNASLESFNECDKNELMEIVEVENTATSESISADENSITENSDKKLVIEVDKNETVEKIMKEAEVVVENLSAFEKNKCLQDTEGDNKEANNKVVKENYMEIAEVVDVKISTKSPEETNTTNLIESAEIADVQISSKSPEETNTTNCMEIVEADDVSKSLKETNATNLIEIAEVIDVKISTKFPEEANTTICTEIVEADDIKINSKSPKETNTTNLVEITQVEDVQIHSKSLQETGTTNCVEISQVEDIKIHSQSSEEIEAINCVEITEADSIKMNSKSPEETNTTTYVEIAKVDDVNINSKSPEETNVTLKNVFKNSKIIPVVSDIKINEKKLEDTNIISKNLNKFGKDYLMKNSEVDNNVVQFSMSLEKPSNNADNIPTTVEEINSFSESADNDDQDDKIDEQDLKSESFNENKMIDVQQDDIICESNNSCEKVVEKEKELISYKMKQISKVSENFDKHQRKTVTEVQNDFTLNDFEFPKNLNENVAEIEIQPTKNLVSSITESLNASSKNDYSVTNETEYTIEEVTIQSSILSPKHLQHIVDSVKNIPATEILEETVHCHGLLNSKGFQDSILAYSEEIKELMDGNCLLQISNETIVETSQVTPSTSLSDNCEASSNFFQAVFSHQSSETGFYYLKGSDHNYHSVSVSDPLLSAKYGATDENDRLNHSKEILPTPELESEDNIMQFISTQTEGNLNQELSTSLNETSVNTSADFQLLDRSLNHDKEIPTPELESEDNIMQFISTQSEGNLNQELSTSLNETSVNTNADFQLLDQCLMENGLGHESSTPLPQRVSCDNVFQHTSKQEVAEYDENSRNSNLEFRESNEEVNINSFQQNEMSTEKMIELLNNITSGNVLFDAETNNFFNQQYKLQNPHQTQKSYEEASVVTTALSKDLSDTLNTSGFTNKSISEFQESPTKLIRDIFDATNSIEHHSDSISISKPSISFDTDFSNIYFSGIQDTFLTRDKTSNNKVIVERIIPPELAKCTKAVDISVASNDNEIKAIDVHHSVNVPQIGQTTPKKKSLTLNESHPKFNLQIQPKNNKVNVDNKLSLDHYLKRHSTRTKPMAPKKKQLNEVPKKSEILNVKSNSELLHTIETINKNNLSEILTQSCNELDLKKLSGRRVSAKTKILNDVAKDGKVCNLTTPKKEDESKTNKNFNKEVTSYLKDLDKLVVKNQNTPKETDNVSVLKLGCTTTDSHSQTMNFTISPSQQKVKDNFEQALSKNDLIDNVKSRKRKPVDYVEKTERKKNSDVNKKLPYRGNQKKIELEEPINKSKGKRKLDQSEDSDAKIKTKFYEIEEHKSPNFSVNLLKQKEKSLEDSDDNISKKKKPRLSLPEPNPTDAIFDRLLKEGSVNYNDISNSSSNNNYSNRNPVSLPTYEHFSPIVQNVDKNMVNLQKSTSNSISIFNTGVQRTIDNKPKKVAIVTPIQSNVKNQHDVKCSQSLYSRGEDYNNIKGHHLYHTNSSSSKSRHYYSNRESSRSRHQEGSSRRREYHSDRKQPSSRTNKTSEHDWLEKMKHAFPQEFTNEVSFEYERGNDTSRSTHQH